MTPAKMFGRMAAASACAGLWLLASTAGAQSVMDDWKSIPMPPPPQLHPAAVDSASTALVLLDMYATSCSTAQRPRCVATLPHVQKLLADARAHHMLVIYSAGPGTADVPKAEPIAQLPSEPTVHGGPDKFMGSDLEKLLADHGIKTVIFVGTSADGAVLYTASHAALLNLKAVVPVDGMSSVNPFSELYTAWHLTNTLGLITRNVVLTRTDMITIK